MLNLQNKDILMDPISLNHLIRVCLLAHLPGMVILAHPTLIGPVLILTECHILICHDIHHTPLIRTLTQEGEGLAIQDIQIH